MPVMKVTVSIKLPDVGLGIAKECAAIIQVPFKGFLEHLFERQSRWLRPKGSTIPKAAMDLSIELEAAPGERLYRDLERHELQKTRELLQRAEKSGAQVPTPAVKLAA